jgi:hypothetical protein
MIKRVSSGWSLRCTRPGIGTVEVTGVSRDEAVAKMRAEIRYRVESCPCGGVPDDYVELEIEESPSRA